MSEPDSVYTVPALQIGKHRLGPYMRPVTCEKCGAILATATEFDGRSAAILFTREGHPALAFRARLVCVCGQERMFYSMPMSAIRLGITDE
jgi:hypothetical protein